MFSAAQKTGKNENRNEKSYHYETSKKNSKKGKEGNKNRFIRKRSLVKFL